MSSDKSDTGGNLSLVDSEKLNYLLTYWIAPPVTLAVIATVVAGFLILVMFVGDHMGDITDNSGFLIFFLIGGGMAIFAPPLAGGIMGYWKGMAWEVPVSVYFATVLVAAIFDSADQAISTMFTHAPGLAVFVGVGMVVAAYVFSDEDKE